MACCQDNSFEPRSNTRAPAIAGSGCDHRISVNGNFHSKKKKTGLRREMQDLQVQRVGLRRLQRFDVIQAESPLLLFTEEGKKGSGYR